MRFALSLAICCVVNSLVTDPLSAQFIMPRPATESEVFMEAPRPLKLHLSRAKRDLQEGNFSDAVDELGSILIQQPGNAAYDDYQAEDYFIPLENSPDPSKIRTSLRTSAQKLLGSMPQKGRDSFELQFGSDARLLLNEAVQAGDIQKLNDVNRMYFHTQAGYQSTMLLGRYHLDQGRPLAGALCFKRLAESPARSQFDPALSILLATCWLYADQPERAESILIDLQQRIPAAQFTRETGLKGFEEPETAVAWLRSIVGSASSRRTRHTTHWLVHRGNSERNAHNSGGMPVRIHRWRVPTANDPDDEDLIKRRQKQFSDSEVPALPTIHPLAIDDHILMRTPDRLLAVDFETGKRKWVFPWATDGSIADHLRSGPVRSVQQNRNSDRAQELSERLWEDAPHGQVSSDGEAVFMLDQLGYANPTGNPVNLFPGGFRQSNGSYPRPYNTLVALSLAKEGALMWMVGGPDGEDEPALKEAFFLGAPLPLLGELCVLAEMKGEIRLVVLDRKTGRLQWSQQLANVEQNSIVSDSLRRLAGASPSFADGVLVCPTSTGAVVAVDVSTRSLLWGFQYTRAARVIRQSFNRRVFAKPDAPLGERWADASVTIADGRVLLTPVESDEMYCLDLLTGKSLWKPMKRDQMLYVAAVEGKRVLMVGKHDLRALDLEDGRVIWKKTLANAAMPAGRGYFSDQYYHLPTTRSELLKISIEDGNIDRRIQTNVPLGNLICYKGDVISHGVDWLATFHQDAPLRELVEKRLRENPDDIEALAWQGQLLLRDEKNAAALRVLQRAFALNQNMDSTRRLLVDTLLVVLREDYMAHHDVATELSELIHEPDHRAEFLRLKAAGLKTAGRTAEAFTTLVEMAGLDGSQSSRGSVPDDRMEQVDRNLTVRHDRWIRQRLMELYEAADETERARMDQQIEARLSAAVQSNTAMQLQRVLRYFGFHGQADQARLALAQNPVSFTEPLAAELLLNDLTQSSSEAVQQTATALLARLLTEQQRLDVALPYYRQLRGKFEHIPGLDGTTGAELIERLPARGPVLSRLEQNHSWPTGKLEIEITPATSSNLRSSYRVDPVHASDRQGMLARTIRVAVDHRNVIVRDDHGRLLARISVAPPNRSLQSVRVPITYWKGNGHLLLMFTGSELVAIDLFRAILGDDDSILWRQSISNSSTTSVRSSSRINITAQRIENALGAVSYRTTDSVKRLVGPSSSISSSGICFVRQRQLICVDPISGQTIWTRDDIEPGSDVFGDSEYIFVSPRNYEYCWVFDALDGSLLGKRAAPPLDQRWKTFGRRVLTTRRVGRDIVLSMENVWTEQAEWQHTFPENSKGCLIDDEEVGVCQPDGRFMVYSIDDGRQMLDTRIDPQSYVFKSIRVHRSHDRYFLIASASPAQRTRTTATDTTSHNAPTINGLVFALDGQSGEPCWPEPVKVQDYRFPLDQPHDIPVLTFIQRSPGVRGSQAAATSVLWIDKRDGQQTKRNGQEGLNSFVHNVEADPGQNTVRLNLGSKAYVLRFTPE